MAIKELMLKGLELISIFLIVSINKVLFLSDSFLKACRVLAGYDYYRAPNTCLGSSFSCCSGADESVLGVKPSSPCMIVHVSIDYKNKHLSAGVDCLVLLSCIIRICLKIPAKEGTIA